MAIYSPALKAGALALIVLQAGIADAQVLCVLGVSPRRIDGDLNIVTRCELDGTEVRGNVTLFAGGSLTARDVRIRGNLTGSSADFVQMNGGRVDRDTRLEQMVGDLIRFDGTELANVALVGNRSRLEVADNEIRDMQVDANVGGVLITGNTIRSLQCEDNSPAPLGADNRIEEGDAEDRGQCANLQLEEPPPAPPPDPTPPPEPTPTPTPTPEPTPTPVPTPTPSPTPSTPPPATPTTNFVPDPNGGGGGAMGWSWLLLLPLAAWRRAKRRPRTR
ncbi:MAG TPA: GlyGly-CTERM sorting domain-containing protein [Gammaproteobacteria bacterium]|nr:GlyGly-CTERM sorting domain-containing protein [Gammaproteobacteria bacterium]